MNTLDLRYDRLTIRLHWATAALVLLLWGSAQIIDWFPKGPPRIYMRSAHVVLGLALATVIVWRLVWRARGGQGLAPVGAPLLRLGSKGVHLLLYALVLGTVALGVANVWVRGDQIFGLFQITSFAPGDKVLRHDIGNWHDTAANLILIVAGLHALAALFHHFVLRDGVLRRMLPEARHR